MLVGAFVDAVIQMLSGMAAGLLGVVCALSPILGGVVGSILGNEWERKKLREEKEKWERKRKKIPKGLKGDPAS